MRIFVTFLALIAISNAALCDQPQRKFYMSFPALGKRDALNNLFAELTLKTTSIDNNYTDSGLQGNFKVIGFKPQVYYNDHHQSESYLDRLKANVTMGVITVASSFNYTIGYSSQSKSGKMVAKGTVDSSYFTKNLTMQLGYLEWAPDYVPSLTLSQFLEIEYSEPKLTSEQLSIFRQMLNNQAGNKKIREESITQINNLYVPLLKQHLNHEDLISTNNITYTYKNVNIIVENYAKEFYLANGVTKGLESFFLFGIQSSTENCTALDKQFDEEYGGLQQQISLGIVRSVVKQALSKGLADVTIDKTWQVPTFQLFMGDLGNFVPNANYAPAGDRFNVTCNFDQSRAANQLKIARSDNQSLYITIPESCTINYQSKPIISFKTTLSFNVRLVGDQKSIKAIVQNTGIFSTTFTSVDPAYKVQSQFLGTYSISQILNGLVGKTVFGTGFPSIYRRYPVIKILEDRLVFYDPSQQ